MPEGPEVRKYADAVDSVLTGRKIISLTARTREARNWLGENGTRLVGRRVSSVRSHGKHLVGLIEGGFYFHSHLMMWGRWQTHLPEAPADIDRRERARIVVEGGAAILYSAPIFNVGEGDPAAQIEHLRTLGPDVLPYPSTIRRKPTQGSGTDATPRTVAPINVEEQVSSVRNSGSVRARTESGAVDRVNLGDEVSTVRGSGWVQRVGRFNAAEFRHRLHQHPDQAIGAALLNQRIVAGLGNYLRAEVLFACRINPWTNVGGLKRRELTCLSRTIPELALRSYLFSATASDEDRERMRTDPLLVYKGRQQDWEPGWDYGTRHLVFRRTNLPCLRCGNPIKQLRQTTMSNESINQAPSLISSPAPASLPEEERSRIIYFCAHCQHVEPM
jgi:formamidopyrimidine-DNA glycosylase